MFKAREKWSGEERKQGRQRKRGSLGERESDEEETGSWRWLAGASLPKKMAAHFGVGGEGGEGRNGKRDKKKNERIGGIRWQPTIGHLNGFFKLNIILPVL